MSQVCKGLNNEDYNGAVQDRHIIRKFYKEHKTVKTNSSYLIDTKLNTHSSSDKDVNPHWPKALVIPSAINSRPEQKKPQQSLIFELKQAFKSKFIYNASQAK